MDFNVHAHFELMSPNEQRDVKISVITFYETSYLPPFSFWEKSQNLHQLSYNLMGYKVHMLLSKVINNTRT